MLKKAFSLVELIVVVSILSILATISYYYYTDYLEETRDHNRVNQLQIMWDWIDLALSKWKTIVPENSISINVEWERYSTQWEAWKSIIDEINYHSEWLDPKEKEYYTLALSKNNKDYDMLALLESKNNSPKKVLSNDFVLDSNWNTPYVYWKNKLWIFVDTNYIPLNKSLSWVLDIDCDTNNNWYKLIFDNWKILDPITWQSDFEYWPCYDENVPPTIPTNTSWTYYWDSSSYSSCSLTCWWGTQTRTVNCKRNDWLIVSDSNCSWVKPVTSQSCNTWACMANYTNLSDLLAGECNINSPEFTANFNSVTWTYNWNIICNWSWIDNTELQFFSIFKTINWNLDLSHNTITNVDPLINLESVNWNFRLNDNLLTNINALATRSSNNFTNIFLWNNQLTNLEWLRNLNSVILLDTFENDINNLSALSSMNSIQTLNLSWNNINDISWIWWSHSLRTLNLSNNSISNIDILFNLSWLINVNISNNNISSVYWLRQTYNLDYLNISWNSWINDLSWFNSYYSDWKTLQLDNRNYTTKANSTSKICTTWIILDQNWNSVSDKSFMCN